jgi:hypothetical protein
VSIDRYLADERLLRNALRRVDRARDFPTGTCPASRHLHIIAKNLAAGKPYPMLDEEPEHCALTMLSVLESLWKARTEIARLRARSGR